METLESQPKITYIEGVKDDLKNMGLQEHIANERKSEGRGPIWNNIGDRILAHVAHIILLGLRLWRCFCCIVKMTICLCIHVLAEYNDYPMKVLIS